MALAQTELPELKRFTFFVSRRFEEGRERFRMHMGYFATLAEAEEWLNVVREIYPGAWAGEAPGRKLRERATAAAVAQAQHAAGPQARATATPAAPAAPPARPAPVARVVAAPAPPVVQPPAASRVPVVHPAPAPLARPAPAAQVAPAAARAPSAVVPPRAAPRVQPPRPVATASAPRAPAAPAAATQAKVAIPKPAIPAATQAKAATSKPAAAAARSPGSPAARANAPTQKPVFEDSNVREVLKALTDSSATGETRLMQIPPLPATQPARPAESSTLTDTQVLRLLEVRRSEASESLPADAGDGSIQLLKPDDTGTRRALKEAIANNAPVAFAVQLQWSVQPVELERVPPLAIFSAYTLYTVEGSRDGRKWYGLRLGFFSDAISAKQVAQYVRSEFNTVAVVPVSPQEKSRASDQEMAATLAAPVAVRPDPMDEFKLIDDRTAAPPPPAAQPKNPGKIPGRPVPRTAAGRAAARAASAQTAQSAPRTRNGKVGARDKRGTQTLEETLEILGASQLSIDNGTGENINDSGVRHLHVEVQKNSPFSRLLVRLSERMKKS
jgi:hypothetical protein